jgi:hypothetical protein
VLEASSQLYCLETFLNKCGSFYFLLWGQLANKSCTILKSHFSATEWFIIYLLECKFVSVVKPLCNQYLYVSSVKLKLQLMSDCITTYIQEAWLLLVLRRDNSPINICLGRVKFWHILHPHFLGSNETCCYKTAQSFNYKQQKMWHYSLMVVCSENQNRI